MKTAGAVAIPILLLLCGGCDTGAGGGPAEVPVRWQRVTLFAAGGNRPRVEAALPPGLERTAETGIDDPLASYRGADLLVRFDFGAEASPGCVPRADRCTTGNSEVGGRPAVVAVSNGADAGVVHSYFVPLGKGRSGGTGSSEGAGLLVTVSCGNGPACPVADQIAGTIRFAE